MWTDSDDRAPKQTFAGPGSRSSEATGSSTAGGKRCKTSRNCRRRLVEGLFGPVTLGSNQDGDRRGGRSNCHPRMVRATQGAKRDPRANERRCASSARRSHSCENGEASTSATRSTQPFSTLLTSVSCVVLFCRSCGLCCCNEPIDSSWLRVVASYIRTRSSSEAPASRDSCAELVADTAKTQSHTVVLAA